MVLQFRQVDVFTESPLLGNPVAVVHGADGVTSEQMQRFAHWWRCCWPTRPRC